MARNPVRRYSLNRWRLKETYKIAALLLLLITPCFFIGTDLHLPFTNFDMFLDKCDWGIE